MRPLLIVPCLLALASAPMPAGEPVAPPAIAATAVVSDSERGLIEAAVAAVIAAGAPDTRGATIVLGEIVVVEPAPASSTKVRSNRRSGNRQEQVADGKKTTTWRGTHLHLTDGRWLMQLGTLVAPAADRTITPGAEAKQLNPTQLAEHLAKNPEEMLDQIGDTSWLEAFTPEAKPRVKATLKAALPLNSLQNYWMGGMGTLMLQRAGVSGANEQLLIMGLQQQWPGYARNQGRTPPLILEQHDGSWRNWNNDDESDEPKDPKAWIEKNKGRLTIPDPTPVIHQQIASWFRGLLLNDTDRESFGISAEQALKQCVAFSPEAQRAATTATLQLLVAGQALPEKAPANADLATKLQSWQPNQRQMSEDDTSNGPSEEMIAQMPADVQEHFRKQLEERGAWRPGESDLPALIDLLGDTRPSRWIDGMTPRTLGDTALRAMYTVMRVDPRVLAGRTVATPWTEAERTASAEAIRAWWKGLGGKPLAEALAAAVENLPLSTSATIIASRKEADRAPLLDRVAAALPATPTKETTGQALAAMLAVAGTHAGIAAKIASWPVTGQLRPLLAVWNDRQGRPAELDKLLEELATNGDRDDLAGGLFGQALKHAMAKPSPARLQRCLALAAGPLTDRRTWAVLAAACGQDSHYDEEWMSVERLDGNGRVFSRSFSNGDEQEKADPAMAIPLAVVCTMLADRRAIGDSVKLEAHGQWGQLILPGARLQVQISADDKPDQNKTDKKNDRPAPTDLRTSDAAAAAARMLAWRIGENESASGLLDLWAPPATRDTAQRTIAEAFAVKARAALAAAKLPDVLPAAAPADPNALF